MNKKIYFAIIAMSLMACDPEDKMDVTDPPIVDTLVYPSDYKSFSDVDYSGQITRVSMSTELVTYVKSAHDGVKLDEAKLTSMFNGTGYTDENLNSSGKKLSDKVATAYKIKFENWIKEAAEVSQAPDSAYKGVAGFINGKDATGKTIKIHVDKNGFEYKELFDKQLMATLLMHQALNTYIENILLQDNITVTIGQGTKMQHHWDEAYGYFVGINDLKNTTGLKFWSNYANRINPVANTLNRMSIAFRKGRAAIDSKNLDQIKIQRDAVKFEWKRLAAAMSIRYVNGAKTGFSDMRTRIHALSECYGFLIALQIAGDNSFNSDITNFENNSLYNVTETQLTDLSNKLAQAYQLTAEQSNLK